MVIHKCGVVIQLWMSGMIKGLVHFWLSIAEAPFVTRISAAVVVLAV